MKTGIIFENSEDDNSSVVVEQWRSFFNALGIFWKMYSNGNWDEDVHILMCGA